MLRRKKKEKEVEVKETELPLGSASQDSEKAIEVQTVEATSTPESIEVVAEVPASEPVASEPVATEVTAPVVGSSDDTMAQLTNTLNSEFKKSGNGLTAQIAKVSNNLTYVLIKAANSAYCFARIGEAKEASRAKLELEFLSNVPSHAHNQIFEICKSLNIPDSKRLFFHPSGIL